MSKKVTYLLRKFLVLFLTCFSVYGFAQNATIPGARAGASSTGVLYATSTSTTVKYAKTASVYTAAEIIAGGGYTGKLTKLWWNKEGTGEYATADAVLRVYIKHVNVSAFAANVTWATDTAGATLVYSSNTYSIPTGTGWKELAFTTPFNWDGYSNIEILVDWFRPSVPTAAINWAYSTATNGNASSTGTTAPTTATRNNNRPLLQLAMDTNATDISMNQIVAPSALFLAGTRNVDIKVKNSGGKLLHTTDLSWSVDGVLQPFTNPYTFSTPLSPATISSTITLGSYNFTYGAHTIKAWTSNPNSVADTNAFNDTLVLNVFASAPMSGVYTIDPSQPASPTNYTSFTTAVSELNNNGISGTVYFDVPAESRFVESNILITATGTATDSIVFRKTGTGANPVIKAAPGLTTNRDFIIGLEGSDHIVFDGIDLKDSISNATTTTQMEWGYAFFVKNDSLNGCQYNTIRNCKIELIEGRSSGTSIGIYTINQAAAIVTTIKAIAMSGTHSYNKFFNDSIVGSMVGISLNGSNDSNFYDEGNSIGIDGANSITRFNSKGITSIYQDNLKIANNTINSITPSLTDIYGIHTQTALNASVDVYNNTITVKCIPALASSSRKVNGIVNKTGEFGLSNVVNIYNNRIIDCYNGGNGASSEFYMIWNDATAALINIHNNLVENDSTAGNATVYVMYNSPSGTTHPSSIVNIHHNTVRNIKRTIASTSNFYGLYNSPLKIGSVSQVYKNEFSNLNVNGGAILGGMNLYGTSNQYVHQNRIFNINNDGGTGKSVGIYILGISTQCNFYISNNYISNLSAPISNNVDAVSGISVNVGDAAAMAGIYYNTIYLDGTSSATTFGSSGIYANSVTPVDIRNNIVINKMTPGSASGIVAAYKRSTTTLGTYSDSSNRNIFYVTPGGNRNYIYSAGTDSSLTMGAYKTTVAPRDNASINYLPFFVNTTVAPYDLHIDPTFPTPVEGNARRITSPVAITVDFDSTLRDTSMPDIGAHEGNFVPADLEGPTIAYAALKNTGSITNRTIVATISDPAGVDSVGAGQPLIYYRKTAGAYFSAPSVSKSGNQFTFIIDNANLGGVNVGDVVEYYIAAQDLATFPNAASSPEGATGANPPGIFAPTVPASYTILTTIGGTYYVGTTPHTPAATYATLKDAFADFGAKGMSAAVEFVLIDTAYNSSTGETLPITIPENPDASAAFTLTVKPETGLNVKIVDAPPIKRSLVKLNGADYVIIDGVNANNTSLTLINSTVIPYSLPADFRIATDSSTAVIWIASLNSTNGANYNTIKNVTLSGYSSSQSQMGIYVGSGANLSLTAPSQYNNTNNIIDSNFISKVRYGVVMVGNSAQTPDAGNKVRYNRFGSASTGDGFFNTAIKTDRMDSVVIANNDIQNVHGYEPTNGEDKYGINLLNTRNAVVTGNRVHNLNYTGNTFTALIGINSLALAYKTAGNPSNNLIYNNSVYDLHSSSTGITFNTAGIVVSDGYGDKIYYNSVHLDGQLSKGQGSSAAFANGVGTLPGNSPTSGNNLEVKNNIFIMTGYQLAGTTAKLYAHYSKLANYSSNILSNNILYVNTTVPAAGFIGGMATTNYSTFATWQAATGTETNSLNVDPLLNTAKILIPTNGSPALAAGTPIAGITTDLLGDARNATTPTIGAYENAGDYRGPTISFTPLANTTDLNNRVLTAYATITDLSGVNVTPGTAPRIYYKKQSDLNTFNGNTSADNGWKWTEATNSSSPFSFVIDYSLLNGGVINVTDTINYFIVAQDNAPAATVGSSAILFNAAASVNLDASSFPITDTNMYRIIPGTQGNLYVGNGQTYPSLTGNGGVFEAIRDNLILTGDLNVIITSDLTEDGTNDLTTWQEEGAGNYRISFRPDQDSVRVITGNVINGLIRLNGAKRIVFDGADTTTNTGRYLTFVNLSTADPVFTFINDAKTDTIRNCNVEGANTSTSDGLIVFLTSATQLTPINAGNDSNVIANNIIRNVSGSTARMGNGVYSAGSNQNRNSHNIITGNQIFNFNGSGVNISSSGSGDEWTITNNHIYDSLSTPATAAQTGILFSPSTSPASKNNTITGNYIGGTAPMAAGGTWFSAGTGTFIGITAAFDTLGTNVVSNNVIRKITRTSTLASTFTGIRITRGDALVADNIIGDTLNAADGIFVTGTGISNGIEITNTVVNSAITVQHNRIANMGSYGVPPTARLRGISYNNTTSNNNSTPLNITNNRISDLASSGMSGGFAAGDQAVTGIYCYPNSSSATFALVNIDGNTIYNIVANNTSDTPTVAAGIVVTQFAGKITANRIYNIRNYAARTVVSSPATAVGILFLNTTQQPLIANNMITAGFDTTDNVQYIGIWNPMNSGGANLYYNTIFVQGANGALQVPTYAFWRGNNNPNDSINSPLNANNNIFYSTRGGSADNTYLLGNNSSVASNTWGVQSWDHNVLVNANGNSIGIWNGTAGTLTAWQALSGKDSASGSVTVAFESVTTGDLHLAPSSYGNVLLEGIPVAAVTTDFDGESRTIHPYMGADENTAFPLPVTLLNITAKRVKNNVQVDWSTASETNSGKFEVEASGDGRTFGFVGSVKARGNSSSLTSYNYTHAQAFENISNKGTLYYRLKMLDQNGSYKYSPVVSVSKEQSLISENDVQVYPNPFTSELAVKVNSSASTQASAQLFDIQGKLITTQHYVVSNGENVLLLNDINEIPDGIYFLKITFGETVLTKKVVKQ